MVGGEDLGLTAAGRWLISGGERLWTGVIRISGETGLCSTATQQLVLTAVASTSSCACLSLSSPLLQITKWLHHPPPTRNRRLKYFLKYQVSSQLATLTRETIFLNVNNCLPSTGLLAIYIMQAGTLRPQPHRCFNFPQPDRLNNLQYRKTWLGTFSDHQSSSIRGRGGWELL